MFFFLGKKCFDCLFLSFIFGFLYITSARSCNNKKKKTKNEKAIEKKETSEAGVRIAAASL